MQAGANNYGYMKLNINKRTTMVAKLVLYTFDRPPVDKEQAIFKDKNKHNLRLDNLQWAKTNPARVAGVSTSARPVVVTDSFGKRTQFSSPSAAANYIGISRDTVYKILSSAKPSRNGFLVKYLVHDGTVESRSLDNITDSVGGVAYADGTIKKPSGGLVQSKASDRDPSNPKQEPYLVVRITSSKGEKHGKRYYIHDIITQAFIGPKPDNKVVNHINGNTWDNRVDNLEYVCQADNVRHACAAGLVTPPGQKKVLQFSYDKEGGVYTLVKEYKSASEAARQLQCSVASVTKKCKISDDELPDSMTKADKHAFQQFVFRYKDDDFSDGRESKKQRVQT